MDGLNHVRFKFMEKELKEELGRQKGPLNLIEIGPARGEFAEKVAKFGNNKLFTVDPEFVPDKLFWRHKKEKAEDMSFRDNFGHVIYLSNVLEYTDMNKTAAQIGRVLKPGGKLIMVLMHKKDVRHKITMESLPEQEEFLRKYHKSMETNPKEAGKFLADPNHHEFLREIINPYAKIAAGMKLPSQKVRVLDSMIKLIELRLKNAKTVKYNSFGSEEEIRSFLIRHGFETKKIEVLEERGMSGGKLLTNKYGYGVVAIKKS